MTGNVALLARIKTTHFTLHERWCWSPLFNWDSILVTIHERRLAEWPSFRHHVGPSVIKGQTRNQRPELLKRRVLTPQQQAGLKCSAGEKFIRFFSLSHCTFQLEFHISSLIPIYSTLLPSSHISHKKLMGVIIHISIREKVFWNSNAQKNYPPAIPYCSCQTAVLDVSMLV